MDLHPYDVERHNTTRHNKTLIETWSMSSVLKAPWLVI
jgi:hypothetical protein